jgi:hypothetical protein
VGIDNAPGGVHRAWRTALRTGETVAKTGPPYGTMFRLPDTYYPGEEGSSSNAATFRGAETGAYRFYAFASEIRDGRVMATDFARDEGWLEPGPS